MALLLASANAGAAPRFGIGASLGQGMLVDPPPVGSLDTTTLMLAPGFQLSPSLRGELGLLLAMQPGGDLDMQVRPMLLVMPAGWPGYGRLTAGVVQLLAGPVALVLGATVGTHTRVGATEEQLLLFAEIGMLVHGAQARDGTAEQHFVLEARLGGYHGLF